ILRTGDSRAVDRQWFPSLAEVRKLARCKTEYRFTVCSRKADLLATGNVESEPGPLRQATDKFARTAGTFLHQLLYPAGDAVIGSGTRFLERPSRCPQPVLPSATSPIGWMVFGGQAQRSCW